jgi:hypothetical protein
MASASRRLDDRGVRYPDWFLEFLADRAIRKLSPHTTKAYRQDFTAIAASLAGNSGRVGDLMPDAVTKPESTDRLCGGGLSCGS